MGNSECKRAKDYLKVTNTVAFDSKSKYGGGSIRFTVDNQILIKQVMEIY